MPRIATFAEGLPNLSRPLIQNWFRHNPAIRQKADSSPLTQADEAVEKALREAIAKQFPAHAIMGEEGGMQQKNNATSPYLWVIDPIDGTRAFATGNPLFGTIIGVVEGGIPKIGVIDLPMLDQCWLGGWIGEDADAPVTRYNGKTVTTHPITDITQARLASTSAAMLGCRHAYDWIDGHSNSVLRRYRDLTDRVRVVNYGGDCANYAYLANGWCDLVAETELSPHDIMGVVPIIQGAGGYITQWDGKTIRMGSFDGTVLASANKKLHDQALSIIA
ncbi:MAG: histidinol phosphate phosphatase [Proteobacteria bacterium]|nr:histidinol phosphate phosphatase [Pseudomonadota bacterium]